MPSDFVDAIAVRLYNGGVGGEGLTVNIRPGESKQEDVRYYGSDGFVLQDPVGASVEIPYADGRVENLTSTTTTGPGRPPVGSPL